jgi:FdrA protein
MTDPVVLNRIRRSFYLDSVALMRLSRDVTALPGVESAAMMIGTANNKRLMADAGLLTEDGEAAGPDDLVVALTAETQAAGEAALAQTETLLDGPMGTDAGSGIWHPKSLNSALQTLTDANLALISVPGEFAADEARKALGKSLHVMLFSDNVPLEDEIALKREAREHGLLLMGPDCGSAIIGGVGLGFANAVPRGNIGIVAASGTGLQEVSSLIARGGGGISHAIGVGGRDLTPEVAGITTLMAIDALDADPETDRIVLISKPPDEAVTRRVFERIAESGKPFTIAFTGAKADRLPANANFAPTLKAAALDALGGDARWNEFNPSAQATAIHLDAGRCHIRGLYSGGTLCAETQAVLLATGLTIQSNVPIPGAEPLSDDDGHTLIDLGADEYTLGRPHPMIEPSIVADALEETLAEPGVAVVLLDVVIGYGAHDDPAGVLAAALARKGKQPTIIASVCGTEDDPQVYSEQVEKLTEVGVVVTPSNADAAALAAAILAR